MNPTLFHAQNGDVTKKDVIDNLHAIGAADCDVLYIHTSMTFGLPKLKRKELLGELLDAIESLGVETLVFPTFTFSFCNNELFDVRETPTPMGAINEFARKTGRGKRSKDPLLSVYLLGNDPGLIDNLSQYSIGKGSNYDRLHACGKNVKFLFFGADMRDCYTYTHYMEAIKESPYRYNREFSGIIRDNGMEEPAKVYLYSTYANCRLTPYPVVHDEMARLGMLHKGKIGEGSICCFSEKDGYAVLDRLLDENPYCLTDGTFDAAHKDTTYNPNGKHITSVR